MSKMSENQNTSVLRNLIKEVNHLPWFESLCEDNIKILSPSGDSLLHSAVILGDLMAVKLLIDKGLDINQKGEHGYTPLHEAAVRGDKSMYDLLINLGADKEIENDDGLLPADLL